MPCPAPNYLGQTETGKAWKNWSGRVGTAVESYFTPIVPGNAGLPLPSPLGLQQLVHLVSQASVQAKAIHAIGSGWANTDMATSTERIVDLKSLCSQLSYVVGASNSALTPAWQARQADPATATKLVHFEAGIEVGRAIEVLESLGLAFPSLGGANGQKLAGVVSTSTHGGEWNLPPLPDLVRAIHLVTPTGQELWIERGSEPITTDAGLRAVLPCADTRIVRSDAVFDAAVVSFGRFGVIYSMVLEVRKAFRVIEVITKPSVQSVLAALDQGRNQAQPFAALFALAAQTPPPPGLVEGNALNGTPPPFFQLLFSSQDPDVLYLQRRWETTNATDLNHPVGATAPGCLMAAGLSELWRHPWGGLAIKGIIGQILADQLRPAIDAGRRGPHWLITSGTRAASHNTSYTGDGIEIVFDARDQKYLYFLQTVLNAGPQYQQAGWISVRPSRASRASLSMHNVAGDYAMSIEATTASGLKDNEKWLAWVHELALSCGGRPHWGQYNSVNDTQVRSLYGASLDNWRAALFEVSGATRTFSNAFSRQRGLEPRAGERFANAACPEPDQLLVVRPQATRQGLRINALAWQGATGWTAGASVEPLTMAAHGFVGIARLQGTARAALCAVAYDGWVQHRLRAADGSWGAWRIVGHSNERALGGIANAPVHAVSCQPDSLHVFYANRQGQVIVARADLRIGQSPWSEHTPLRLGRTLPGGHVTAVSRRPGQIDAFIVGTDGQVLTAAWNASEGWKGWWPIPGVIGIPGSHVSAVCKQADQLDLFIADVSGRTMATQWQPGMPAWGPWVDVLGGRTAPGGYVTGVSRSTGLLDIFTAGTDARLYTAAWQAGRGWAGWWPVAGANLTGMASGVSRSADKIDVFYIAGNGTLQSVAWEPAAGWRGPWTLG